MGRMGEHVVKVKVQDTGPGIAAGDQAFIFGGKFAQNSRGFQSHGLGSGLGLHLAAQIIHMLRGELTLVSPLDNGRGTSFSFSIPCTFLETTTLAHSDLPVDVGVHGDNVAMQSDDVVTLRNTTSTLRALIVEDDDLNVLVMQSSLEMGMKQTYNASVQVTRAR